MAKQIFNNDHFDEAKCQKTYNQIEFFHIKALEMRRRLFRGDHPDVVTSLNNLALFYSSQGKYTEAELLVIKALEINYHSDVATKVNDTN